MQSFDSLTDIKPTKTSDMPCKTPQGCKKSEAKSEAAIYVHMLFLYMRLKVMISGRGQACFKHVSLHATNKTNARLQSRFM